MVREVVVVGGGCVLAYCVYRRFLGSFGWPRVPPEMEADFTRQLRPQSFALFNFLHTPGLRQAPNSHKSR